MKPAPKKVERVISGLEIDERIDLHIRSWSIQPIAWIGIGIFVLLGALGFFGTGPLSKATSKSPNVRIQYQRFHRQGLI